MFAAATGWPCSTCSTTRLSEQPGTTAGDHLLPAVVLLAVLGGSLALYPRLRAGSREALAVVGLGILVTTAGAMHVVHAVIDEAERSDFTGMLAALGGVAMIALGLVVAWRAPAAASWKRRWGKRGAMRPAHSWSGSTSSCRSGPQSSSHATPRIHLDLAAGC